MKTSAKHFGQAVGP